MLIPQSWPSSSFWATSCHSLKSKDLRVPKYRMQIYNNVSLKRAKCSKLNRNCFEWHSSRSQKCSYYINLEKYSPGSLWKWKTHTKMCMLQPSEEMRCFICRFFRDPDGPRDPYSHNPHWSLFRKLLKTSWSPTTCPSKDLQHYKQC